MLGASASSNKRGKVLYDFTATAENQINLKAGSTVQILTLGNKGGWSKAVDPQSGFYSSLFTSLILH